MPKYKAEAPTELISQLDTLSSSCEEICGRMTKAGAEVTLQQARANTAAAFKDSEGMLSCLKMTRTYKTPSDDGINTKVGFYGYFVNRNGVRTPAPMVANAKEHGTSTMNKNPFFRRSFNKNNIQRAMEAELKKYLPKE